MSYAALGVDYTQGGELFTSGVAPAAESGQVMVGAPLWTGTSVAPSGGKTMTLRSAAAPAYPWDQKSLATEALQKRVNVALDAKGYKPIPVDGVLGPTTCAAARLVGMAPTTCRSYGALPPRKTSRLDLRIGTKSDTSAAETAAADAAAAEAAAVAETAPPATPATPLVMATRAMAPQTDYWGRPGGFWTRPRLVMAGIVIVAGGYFLLRRRG